jgi:glycosyltransferase involved in cell wall biosynthesis
VTALTRRSPQLIMVSPRPDALGGMSAVLSSYKKSGLSDRYFMRYVETIGDDGLVTRVWDSALRTLLGCLVVVRAPAGSLVHVHMAERGSFYRKSIVLLAAHARRLPTVVHIHGAEFDRFVSAGSAIQAGLVRYVLGSAGAVIALSDSWRARLAAVAPRSNLVVIENPVSAPARSALSAEQGGVLFLGRLGERKGVDTLLSAIALMQEAGLPCRFTLAGDGAVVEVRAAVARLPVPELVAVPGWVESEHVHDHLFPSHGVLCLPSRAEGQPIALLEAMAYGMACVVTPVGGIPDTVRDGIDAIVVPVDDAHALADALTMLLQDAERRVSIGRAAKDAARERFGLQRHLEALEGLYSTLGFEPAARFSSASTGSYSSACE